MLGVLHHPVGKGASQCTVLPPPTSPLVLCLVVLVPLLTSDRVQLFSVLQPTRNNYCITYPLAHWICTLCVLFACTHTHTSTPVTPTPALVRPHCRYRHLGR